MVLWAMSGLSNGKSFGAGGGSRGGSRRASVGVTVAEVGKIKALTGKCAANSPANTVREKMPGIPKKRMRGNEWVVEASEAVMLGHY